MRHTPSPKQRVRSIFLILILGVVGGVAAVAFLLYNYGPTGQYLGDHVLLSPTIMNDMWFSDSNPKTGGNSRYVLSHIEYEKRGEKPEEIDLLEYARIYDLIVVDKSVVNPEEASLAFGGSPLVTLSIFVKTESDASWQAVTKRFQLIEVSATGNAYRVELHEENKGAHWVYFNHPRIGQKIEQIVKAQ